MDALLVSAGAVAVAEIGDKTQLLALLLATRLRRPVPIILGILVATLVNHALAASAGVAAAEWLGGEWLRWGLGLSFLAMSAWMAVPDKLDREPWLAARLGPFLATAAAFFVVEIGDKTQLATIAMAARYGDLIGVTCGTTLGMMVANVPVVLCGGMIAERVPLGLMRGVAAVVFGLLGVLTLTGADGFFA